MTRAIGTLLTGLLLATAVSCPLLDAADKKDDKKDGATVVKTEDGLRFRLPPDWPIEKRGGITGPIPVEEYLSRKFSAVDSRLRQLETQITALELRLRVFEEEQKKQRLKSTEGAP